MLLTHLLDMLTVPIRRNPHEFRSERFDINYFLMLLSILFTMELSYIFSVQLPIAEPALMLFPSRENMPAPVSRTPVDERMKALYTRPLFEKGRRPPEPSNEVTLKVSTLPRLSGIVISSVNREAIFGVADGKRPLVVHEGTILGEWTVGTIVQGEVWLVGPKGLLVLHPIYDPSSHIVASPLPISMLILIPGFPSRPN